MGKTEKIGLVAGRGKLPFVALEEIHRRGAGAVVVGLAGEVGRELADARISAIWAIELVFDPALRPSLRFLRAARIRGLCFLEAQFHRPEAIEISSIGS